LPAGLGRLTAGEPAWGLAVEPQAHSARHVERQAAAGLRGVMRAQRRG